MLTKLVLIGMVVVAVWALVLRPLLAPRRRQARREMPRPVALIACPHCGVYRDPGEPCRCEAQK